MGELAEAPIFIDDTSGITVSDLRTKARVYITSTRLP
jgi:replicative DNA helicase